VPNKPFNPIARKTRSGLTAALGMNTETLLSVGILIAVASAAFICVWLASKRLQTVTSCYVLAGILWTAAFVTVWFTDTNVPLYSSHYRPGGEPAPVWLATLAFFIRSAAFASIFVAASRHRNAVEPNNRVQATRETRAPDA
jgi:hypothetical protein